MKKTLALAAALTVLITANTWADATIGLNNYGTSGNPIFVEVQGTLAPTATTFVELLAGNNADTGTPIVDRSTGSSIIPLSEDGMFFGGVGVVPGLADSATSDFTLRAWTGAAGSTWATATARGSATWNQATGSWNPNAVPPAIPLGPDLANPAVVIVVPEPSTIALGLLGGAALLFFRRK